MSPSSVFSRWCRAFRRDRRGSVSVEFAFLSGIAILILLGGVEAARYTLTLQKLDRVASSVGDLVSQSKVLSTQDLGNIFQASQQVFEPFSLSARGVVIISFVRSDISGDHKVIWRRTGGGTLSSASQVGTVGQQANLPAGLTMEAGDGLVIVEVVYVYEALVYAVIFGPDSHRHTSYHRPRLTSDIGIE